MIDWEKYNDNFQFYGKEVEFQLIELFESEYAERMEHIRKSVLERDFDQIKFHAHSLKGTVANYMDPDPVALCRVLEEKAKNADSHELDDLFSRLETTTRSLLSELLAHKTTLKTVE